MHHELLPMDKNCLIKVALEYVTMGTVEKGYLRRAGNGFQAEWCAVEQLRLWLLGIESVC